MTSNITVTESSLSKDEYPFLIDDIDSLDDLLSLSSSSISALSTNRTHTPSDEYEAIATHDTTTTTTTTTTKKKRKKSAKKASLDLHKLQQTEFSSSKRVKIVESSSIIRFPLEIQRCMNSGDLDTLKTIIDDICIDNCIFQTSAMKISQYGRDKIFEMFASSSRTLPDITFICTKQKYHPNYNVVIVYMTITGTKQFGDPNEYMYNQIQFGPQNVNPSLREKAFAIEQVGGRFKITSELRFYWKLDVSHIKITHFLMAIIPKQVQPAVDTTTTTTTTAFTTTSSTSFSSISST